MTNVKAATADDGSALATSSCSFRLVAFEGLPFALKILARHFPGSFSNALISNPLYCMRDPLRAFTAGRKDEQKLAAANLTKNAQSPSTSALGRRESGLIRLIRPMTAAHPPVPNIIRKKSRGRIALSR
jgi:hypothetical protein